MALLALSQWELDIVTQLRSAEKRKSQPTLLTLNVFDSSGNLPEHHHNHKERRRSKISARKRVFDVRVLFLAAERRHADQARHAHGEETESRKRVAGQNARGDEEAESWEHGDDGDDAERAVLLASTIVGCW
jgi:hypothetical protein